MQRHFALLACTIGIASLTHAQGCLPEGLVLTSQAQVNSFPADYPGCTTIEGYVRINFVTDLTPLSQITVVEGYLQIGNNQITNLNGLNNITYVGGRLGIEGNGQLNNIGALSSLTAIGGALAVNTNPALSNLSGLENVATVVGDLQITESAGLANLQGLEGLTGIGGGMEVRENPVLTSMQGLAPTSMGGYLTVRLNPLLEDLVAMQGLSSLGGGVFLIGNTALTSLMDLQNILAINGSLTIGQSPALITLDGVGQINPSTITNLAIANCPGLSQCAVESVCSYLADPANTANIHSNASGCADRAEVEDACTLLSVNDAAHSDRLLVIFPNPTTGMLWLRLNGQGTMELRVHDLAGRTVHMQRLAGNGARDEAVDLSHLGEGVYSLAVQVEGGMLGAKRLVVAR